MHSNILEDFYWLSYFSYHSYLTVNNCKHILSHSTRYYSAFWEAVFPECCVNSHCSIVVRSENHLMYKTINLIPRLSPHVKVDCTLWPPRNVVKSHITRSLRKERALEWGYKTILWGPACKYSAYPRHLENQWWWCHTFVCTVPRTLHHPECILWLWGQRIHRIPEEDTSYWPLPPATWEKEGGTKRKRWGSIVTVDSK